MSTPITASQPSLTGYKVDALQNVLANSIQSATYVILKVNDSYFALNKITGNVDAENTDAATVIQHALNSSIGGGSVVISPGQYYLNNAIVMPTSTILTGSGIDVTILIASQDTPAVIMNGHSITLRDITLYHNNPNYTSSVLQLLDARQCNVLNCGLYDTGYNIGTAIELQNSAAASAGTSVTENIFSNINTNGFQNALLFTILNTGNDIDGNIFSQCLLSGCQNVVTSNVAASTAIDDNVFIVVNAYNVAGNPFTTSVYNFDDTATHYGTKFIGCTAFNVPGGVYAYATNYQTELALIATFPNADASIGGSGGYAKVASGQITREYSPNTTETLTNKTISSATNTITLATPLTIGTNLLLSDTGLTGARSFEFPDISDTVATLTANQALTNKTLDGSTTLSANSSGSTTALLATGNCPATTGTAPYTWIAVKAGDNSVIYIPAWK